jgi:ATP-dependent DNA ligase
MLLRSGRLPTGSDYAFEPKWDGFRALVSRNNHLRVRSRRGWDMTSLVPELAALPDGLAVDSELVAFGDDGLPRFPRLCDRMLHSKRRVEVMLIVFEVLAIDGRAVHRRPYWEPPAARITRPRRRLLVDHSQPHRRRSVVGEDLRASGEPDRRHEDPEDDQDPTPFLTEA